MLVLSRRVSQSILMPDLGVSVEVRKISGAVVQLGISAPPTVNILRQELNDKKASGGSAHPMGTSQAKQDSCRVVESNQPRPQALLVEDDHDEAKILASFLRLKRVDVTIAEDGLRAMTLLQSIPRPDCVLLDMNMPAFDGRWTIEAIRRLKAVEGLKVFALSGHDPRECGIEMGERGVDGWFPKPVNPLQIVEQIAKLHKTGWKPAGTVI